MNLRIATCSIAISAAFAAATPLTAAAAPSVAFKTPSNGSTVSGNIYQSSACEVSGSNIDRVRFYLGSTWLNTEENAPWNCNLDTRKFADGTHTLRAIAYDSSGASASTQISINIKNSTTSSTSPTVGFKTPTSGATLSGNIYQSSACEVTGSNISKVVFFLDGTQLNTEGSAPWNCNLDTRKFADGAHSLKAVAYNSSGASAASQISVNIKNSTTTTTSTSTGPTVSFKTPTSGATLSGNIYQSSACEVSGSNIAKVQFWLDGTALNTELASPWNCNLDTTKFADGTHTLKATAYNSSGTSATSQISVNIKNGTTSTGAVSSADIVNQAQAETPFSQQNGYNTQALSQYLQAPDIPESGMHYNTLSNGETIRLGKHTDPRNSTRKALVFQLDPKDPTTSGSKRTEIKFPNNIEINKVYWTAFSIYVYDWGTLSTSDDALFGLQQHNGSPADLSPNFALITSGTGRTFQVLALGSNSTSPSYSNTVSYKYAEQPIPFGRWADFVFKFKLDPYGNGFLQVWMDGNQIVNHKGILGYITPGYKDFFKFGYYNWSGSNFASTRKVLLRSPVVVADPTGTKYKPEDLRAYVNAH